MRLTAMMRERQLTCHPTKTCYLVFGSDKYKEQVKKELEQEPLTFGDFQVRQKESDVYLGDELTAARGLEASTEATVAKRVARAQGAMFEAKSLIQDFRMQAIGGMEGAWDLWNHGICPSILANCGSWVKLSKKALGLLEECQNQYLRMTYSCPSSTPVPALRSQAGMVSMQHRVWTEQICLVAKILHRSDKNSYCRQILEEQVAMNWEGITREAREACSRIGLPDVTKKYIPREDIKEAIMYNNMSVVKGEMQSDKYKKLDKIKYADCRYMQPYMREKSLEDSRLEFRWMTDMLDTRTTMPGRYGRKKTCPHCPAGQEEGQEESPDHLLVCEAYSSLREGMDPELVRRDRVMYLRQVIKVRETLESKLK